MSALHEVCSCGARFDYQSDKGTWSPGAECRLAAKGWREQHRHEMPTPPTPEQPERHDTTLDALVERSGNDPDRKAELDVRMGFR